MAGTARPSDDILIGSGIECTSYEILPEYNCAGGSPQELFDGRTPNAWTTGSCDTTYATNYFCLKFNMYVNIYRCGTDSWRHGIEPSIIYKLNETTLEYEEITSTITQNLSPITNYQWELYIEDLPPGTYKFHGTGKTRVDSEWFLERVPSEILKSNSQYYSINPEYYNTDTKMYETVELKDFQSCRFLIDDLFTEVTIGEETFKPIDKFNKFSIVSQNNNKMTIRGTKSNSELIVANGDIDVSIAETIHSFALKSSQTSDTNIKAVLSLNEGKSWNTYFEGNLVALDVVIPLGGYNNLTSEQKKEWDNAKQTILKNGIPVQVFNALDFNTLTDSLYKLRFAYVVLRENYNDLAELDSLQWNFDAKGIMRKMKNSEYDVCSYLNKIIVTTSIDTEILNTNIMI